MAVYSPCSCKKLSNNISLHRFIPRPEIPVKIQRTALTAPQKTSKNNWHIAIYVLYNKKSNIALQNHAVHPTFSFYMVRLVSPFLSIFAPISAWCKMLLVPICDATLFVVAANKAIPAHTGDKKRQKKYLILVTTGVHMKDIRLEYLPRMLWVILRIHCLESNLAGTLHFPLDSTRLDAGPGVVKDL